MFAKLKLQKVKVNKFWCFPSGNTPLTVTGTNLDIIQTPLIRAKCKNSETVNVSANVFHTVNDRSAFT